LSPAQAAKVISLLEATIDYIADPDEAKKYLDAVSSAFDAESSRRRRRILATANEIAV